MPELTRVLAACLGIQRWLVDEQEWTWVIESLGGLILYTDGTYGSFHDPVP